MKICLIKLASPYLEYQFSDPPLGILYVHSALRKAGYDVHFTDMGWDTYIPKADVYGISCTSLDYEQACHIATVIKATYGNVKIILGGPHATLFGYDKVHPEIDIFFKGEGENLPYLLKQIDLFSSRVFISPVIKNLDSVPFPARDVLRKDLYFSYAKTVFGGAEIASGNSGTVMTSRGCPRRCSFCASPNLWKRKVYFRSVDNVMKEIDELIEKYDVKAIRFQDDNFTLGKDRLKDLCDKLAERKVFWRCSTRSDLIDIKVLEMLWKGGCREIGFGIESGEDSVLKLLHKDLTVEQQRNAMMLARMYGFRTRMFAVTGLPGETKDSGSKLVEFMEKTKPDVVTICSFMPVPGSDIYEHPDKYDGKIIERDFSKYDFTLKWEKNRPFAFKLNKLSIDQMEENREKIKRYIFNNKICNCFAFNKEYV
jgi:anaerobic magnesium-protoporphyrin IX monomethyl ester cyclase